MSVRLSLLRWLRQIRDRHSRSGTMPLQEARQRHRSDARRRLALWRAPLEPVRSSRPRGLWVGEPSRLPPDSTGGPCVLYFHGGGYVMGSPGTHLPVAARFADAVEAPVMLARYRLAPRHPYPAAVEDGVRAYADLVDGGWPPGQIVIAGESAGGGLALASVLSAVARSMLPPAGLVLIGPWTRLGRDAETPDPAGPAPTAGMLDHWATTYLAGCDPADPLASPGLASMLRMPPTLIVVGETDGLLSDATALAARMEEAQRPVELVTVPGAFHGFHHYACPETDSVFETVRRFAREVTRAA